ncbi:cupin domain-containing protein [Mesorhizobium escarrei]|uniref:Cupin domain protein n=1 Tax=Mesorhizobium escarrei TaxID=666018 RepID=A0ABM9DPH7_9HYPH|nr:cupin domain-containing protein [Mesorhizobium escarrei]CAH2398551.1 Cupin domain protein [Mesorhizobium escarrei]
MIRTILYSTAALATLVATAALAEDSAGVPFKGVKLVYDHPLPNVPGKSMRGVLVEYEPGGTSPAHLHPKSAFIYATVLEGAIKSQVNDGPVTTYRAGESWSEYPGDRHSVSQNASATESARLLAVFVVDTDETELVIPYDE